LNGPQSPQQKLNFLFQAINRRHYVDNDLAQLENLINDTLTNE